MADGSRSFFKVVNGVIVTKLPYYYCETHKTVKTRNIYGMLLCCKKLANKARDN